MMGKAPPLGDDDKEFGGQEGDRKSLPDRLF